MRYEALGGASFGKRGQKRDFRVLRYPRNRNTRHFRAVHILVSSYKLVRASVLLLINSHNTCFGTQNKMCDAASRGLVECASDQR